MVATRIAEGQSVPLFGIQTLIPPSGRTPRHSLFVGDRRYPTSLRQIATPLWVLLKVVCKIVLKSLQVLPTMSRGILNLATLVLLKCPVHLNSVVLFPLRIARTTLTIVRAPEKLTAPPAPHILPNAPAAHTTCYS